MSKTKFSKPGVLLAILVAASSIAGYQTLRVTFLQALQNDQYTHILLILPLSVALIFVEWPSVREMMAPSLGAGCVLITISVLSAGSTIWWPPSLRSDVLVSIRMFALVLFWIGACVLCLGSRLARRLIFPLCFLFFLVPLPKS